MNVTFNGRTFLYQGPLNHLSFLIGRLRSQLFPALQIIAIFTATICTTQAKPSLTSAARSKMTLQAFVGPPRWVSNDSNKATTVPLCLGGNHGSICFDMKCFHGSHVVLVSVLQRTQNSSILCLTCALSITPPPDGG